MTTELALDIARATQMVLSNRPTKPVDALFIHGRSFGDWTGIFEQARDLVQTDTVGKVVLYSNEGERFGDESKTKYQSNPGRTWCVEQLLAIGVPTDRIVWPNKEVSGLHTRWESDDFIELSRANRWTTAAITCQPHQALRAYLGWIRSMELQNWTMDLTVATPQSTPWHEVVKGSQGTEQKPRYQHIADEIGRIPTYQARTDIVSFKQFDRYFEQRELGQLKLG